jgi:hypothetical protein
LEHVSSNCHFSESRRERLSDLALRQANNIGEVGMGAREKLPGVEMAYSVDLPTRFV